MVIGTRSAVFAPLRNLSLLILDEEQEGSYKSENTPRYHARDVAKYRCVQENALLVLGSATPAVETMYSAREGSITNLPSPSATTRSPAPGPHRGPEGGVAGGNGERSAACWPGKLGTT